MRSAVSAVGASAEATGREAGPENAPPVRAGPTTEAEPATTREAANFSDGLVKDRGHRLTFVASRLKRPAVDLTNLGDYGGWRDRWR